jgi:hypothetical protein
MKFHPLQMFAVRLMGGDASCLSVCSPSPVSLSPSVHANTHGFRHYTPVCCTIPRPVQLLVYSPYAHASWQGALSAPWIRPPHVKFLFNSVRISRLHLRLTCSAYTKFHDSCCHGLKVDTEWDLSFVNGRRKTEENYCFLNTF